jgi:hypothetical protein
VPCFIRIIRRLGIEVPTQDLEFTEWIEEELRRELNAKSHEELYNIMAYYEAFYPEKLKDLLKAILQKRAKKEELAIV